MFFKFKNLMPILLVVLISWTSTVYSEQATTTDDLFDMSLEELMDVSIVSASRQKQRLQDSSVAVTVITSEDIHYSGITSVADILQYVPGMDVLKADRNRYILGYRGLHHSMSDRTLVLINGRHAGNVIFGGADFTRLPVSPEDIESIEVVRGPGGASWGANAFNGVINIITKKPDQINGVLHSLTINEYGDTYNHTQMGGQSESFDWRASIGYDDQESSEDAISGDKFSSDDFRRSLKFDWENLWHISDRERLSFGFAHARIQRGSFDFMGMGNGNGRENIHSTRLFTRFERDYDNNTSVYVQWFGNFDKEERPAAWEARTSENDIEAQIDFDMFDSHRVSIGGNTRHIRINTERSNSAIQMNFPDDSFNEFMSGVFLIDRWKISDRLAFEGQIRSDWYTGTHSDWSTRLSAMYSLDDNSDNVIRFSYARSYRSPFISLREMEYLSMPFSLFKADDLKNEEIKSWEIGYTSKLDENWTLQLDGYMQRYEELIGLNSLTMGFPVQKQFGNVDGADAKGLTAQLTWRKENAKVTGWYAYNDFQPDQQNQSIRSFGPAKHKFGVSCRVKKADWVVNANYKYSSHTPMYVSSSTIKDITHFNSLDLTLSKGICDGNGEFMVGVSDLMDQTDITVKESNASAHETPGRTFFARLQYKF